MAVDDDGDGANSLPDAEGSRAPDLAGLLREQKHHSKARNKQAGQPYWTESASEQPSRTAPRRAGSVRKTGAKREHRKCRNDVLGSLV